MHSYHPVWPFALPSPLWATYRGKSSLSQSSCENGTVQLCTHSAYKTRTARSVCLTGDVVAIGKKDELRDQNWSIKVRICSKERQNQGLILTTPAAGAVISQLSFFFVFFFAFRTVVGDQCKSFWFSSFPSHAPLIALLVPMPMPARPLTQPHFECQSCLCSASAPCGDQFFQDWVPSGASCCMAGSREDLRRAQSYSSYFLRVNIK